MNYLAVTHETAKWLLAKKGLLRAVGDKLPRLASARELEKTVLSSGNVRATATADGRLLALWNRDYLSNTDNEAWGVIRLEGPYSLLSMYLEEVFERQLEIISRRIEGLLLDGRWIHKNLGKGVHSCIAGRGTESRQYWVMYGEVTITTKAAEARAVVCLGPERGSAGFEAATRHDLAQLRQLARASNGLLTTASQRPVAASDPLVGLKPARVEPRVTDTPEPVAPALVVPVLDSGRNEVNKFLAERWSYDEWIAPSSSLTSTQRRILESAIFEQQPLRIRGAAGSGKTLLMMLLALRALRKAREEARPLRVFYLVHNGAMHEKVWMRFITLGGELFLDDAADQSLEVRTLFGYSRDVLEVSEGAVFDPDAQDSKNFQREMIIHALRAVLKTHTKTVDASGFLVDVTSSDDLFTVFAGLVTDEVSVAIKGHGLGTDQNTYVGSSRRLSRLHGVMGPREREFVFEVYKEYQRQVFEELEVFDTDDLAVSLLARLNTPLWAMQRRTLGYDYVFVDETQLFNENERRLFPLFTKGTTLHVPVVLSLDEAQQPRAATSAGLGLLGFDQLSDESLETVHRSTHSILRLAFFVIQYTTDLFGVEFPDFTGTTQPMVQDSHKLARPPEIRRATQEHGIHGEILRQLKALRRDNIRQIGIVCHTDRYWDEVRKAVSETHLAFVVLDQRGVSLDPNKPIVAVGRPDTIGGQEFDAVLAVGLEQGVVPPRFANQALTAALEQQALREMYVSFTRARYRLSVVNSHGTAPTRVLEEAARKGLAKTITSRRSLSRKA